MRAMIRLQFLVLIGVAATAPVLAQDRPPNIYPTRDVAVTYRVNPPSGGAQSGSPVEMGFAYLAAERKVRMDLGAVLPGMNAWGLVDLGARRFDVVIETLRAVMPGPANVDVTRVMRIIEGARVSRLGTATIAGFRCTDWRYEQDGGRGTICLTDDGVILRAAPERGESREATRVTYSPQEPARFRVPSGYQQLSMEDLGRALGAVPPSQQRR